METENYGTGGNEEAELEGGEQQQSEGGALRKQYEATLDENKQLKSQLRKQGFQIAGIDPEQGVGKLLYQAYDGEADVSQIREFAQEHGIEPQQGSVSSEQPAEPPELNDEERGRQEAHRRLSSLQGGSQSGAKAPSLADQIAAAEQKGHETGDWSEFDQLQLQTLFDK